jgi:hypothetical protein
MSGRLDRQVPAAVCSWNPVVSIASAGSSSPTSPMIVAHPPPHATGINCPVGCIVSRSYSVRSSSRPTR